MQGKLIKVISFLLLAIIFPARAATPINIGAIYNLTGVQAPLDKPSLRGVELAIKEINQQGGVLGRPLKLVIVNGESNPQVIQTEAVQLANNPNIPVVIGLSDTNMVLAAAPKVAQAKKIFLTSGATSPLLIQQIPNYLFLACFTDQAQAKALANFAYANLQAKNINVLMDSGMDYTKLLTQYFTQTYQQLSGKISQQDSFLHDQPQIQTNLEKLKQLQAPDVFFIASGPEEAVTLITQVRNAAFQQPILGGDSFDSAKITTNKIFDNVYFAAHGFINTANPDMKVQNFIKSYQKNFKQMPESNFTGLGYDSVQLLAAAITQAKSTNTEDIRQALANLKYQGVTGNFDYQNSQIPKKTVFILKMQNGKETLASQIAS